MKTPKPIVLAGILALVPPALTAEVAAPKAAPSEQKTLASAYAHAFTLLDSRSVTLVTRRDGKVSVIKQVLSVTEVDGLLLVTLGLHKQKVIINPSDVEFIAEGNYPEIIDGGTWRPDRSPPEGDRLHPENDRPPSDADRPPIRGLH